MCKYKYNQRVGNITLYVRDADQKTIERCKQMLEEESRSLSEFFAQAAADYVETRRTAEPEEIILHGDGGKKIFRGHTLYREDHQGNQIGVFFTAKRQIACWMHTPGAAHGGTDSFQVYPTLTKFFEENPWLEERRGQAVTTQIKVAYQKFSSQTLVEYLDI